MSTLKLLKYTDDNERLENVDDAEFVRERKLPDGVELDFAGVSGVTAEFLDELLKGQTPESIADRLLNMNQDVEEAMVAWIDRSSSPVIPVETTKKRGKVSRPAVPNKPVETVPTRAPTGDERFTPTRLIERLKGSLQGYIESAYPLSDPTMIRSRRILLETEAEGHLLSQEPYIETTTRYATSKRGYADIGLPSHIAELFGDLSETRTQHSTDEHHRTVLYPSMYGHQERAFRSYLADGKDIIVATGTGSGKTECFLVPMLGQFYDEATTRPDSFAKHGVRALILYPMNALVNDQMSRLRLLFGESSVSDAFSSLEAVRVPRFGMYTGRTTYPGPRKGGRDSERVEPLLDYYLGMSSELRERLQRIGRYPSKDLRAFLAKHEVREVITKTGKHKGKPRKKNHWEKRLHTSPGDRELLTRQEMVHGSGTKPGHAPDILVTNYSMLEYMLMRPFERPIFNETKAWLAQEGNQFLLVLDEAHMYRGAKGAEVAFLIRRLRARLGIHDRPDKLRVIATSASLGESKDAQLKVKHFVADLTGKSPDDFEAITGNRTIPEPARPATAQETKALAELNLDAINEADDADELRALLQPFVAGATDGNDDSEAAVLAELYSSLEGQPYVNQLVKEAAGNAQALRRLAEAVFPGETLASRALQGLLTIGTLARKKPDEPGLIPTRVHGMFRGLHGLYACINPDCNGRQSEPGDNTVLGKLFSTPRINCDACGSRVFEIASCRECGTAYSIAYAPEGRLGDLDFLWGETEGAVFRLQMLPSTPRHRQNTEEVRVHLATGFVDQENRFPNEEVRSVHLWVDNDQERQPTFDRCAMCQTSPRATSRIFDFRTRGEQPFTALIEAQFAEQPPQKHDPDLKNHGRKVLVFSDGRQKAARLAPALEHSHSRDLFRQVVALASDLLEKKTGGAGVSLLYPTIVWLCANEGYDLFPFPEKTKKDDADSKAVVEFRTQLQMVRSKSLPDVLKWSDRGRIKPVSLYAKYLFQELTDKYFSFSSLALGSVQEDPAIAEFILEDFPDVGLDEDSRRVLFRIWIRRQMEESRFYPDGAAIRELGEEFWMRPRGIDPSNLSQLLPSGFAEYIDELLEGDDDACRQLKLWFQKIVRETGVFESEGDLYYFKPSGLSLQLRLHDAWLRCVDCNRIHPEVLNDTCPACLGDVVDADDDYIEARAGFYRKQVFRAFDRSKIEPFGLAAAEHSAQLTGQPDDRAFNKVEEYELRFQDVALQNPKTGHRLSPIDVLSCTTTMEVGVDIGALSGVALRNVPPHVANYQQRAGRAGRRGRSIASVVTYAHGSSHDAHFFAHPSDIISGSVRTPEVYIQNQQVLLRHIHAYLVQRYFHASPGSAASYDLFGSLGKVGQFLSEDHPFSLLKFEKWLEIHRDALQSELDSWVPHFSHDTQLPITEARQTVAESIDTAKQRVREVLPVEAFVKQDELTELEQEALQHSLDEELLQRLIGQAVLPRYAFPTDVVTFWVMKQRQRGQPAGKREYDYQPQRDLQLALTEYAPGRSLTIDKWRFESAAIYSPFQPSPQPTLDSSKPYTSCNNCTWVSLEPDASSLTLCPICGSDELSRMDFITPAGFASDMGERRRVDRGQSISYAGRTDRARLELQDPPGDWDSEPFGGRLAVWSGSRNLAMVNKGIGGRGFRVCGQCGRAEPAYGPGYTATKLTKGEVPTDHSHPMEPGVVCSGRAQGPFYLGHSFPTDALLLRLRVGQPVRLGTTNTPGLLSRAARMGLTSLVEAIALSASRVLQIDEGELAGWWAPVLGPNTNEAQLYLYDLLAGGAGYARAVGLALDEVFDATEKLLLGCDCMSSCYKCIRHYGNNWIHTSLDRHLALSLLQHIRNETTPILSDADKSSSLEALCEYLKLRGFMVRRDFDADGVRVPLSVTLPNGEFWVDVHHAIVDSNSTGQAVTAAANSKFLQSVVLDAFDLLHDLPAAVGRLNLPQGQGDE